MIVGRNELRLYDYVRRRFTGESVEVVRDRRFRDRHERREQDQSPAVERRGQTDRRVHRVDDHLKAQGWVVVRRDEQTTAR